VHVPSLPRRPGIVGLVGLALLLAACSTTTSAGSTTTTRSGSDPGGHSVCSLVTPAQIDSTLARQVGPATVVNSTASTACRFPSASGATPSDSVIVTFRGHVSDATAASEQAALAKLHGSTSPVTVSSGQAYTYSVATGGHTVNSLVTLVGDTQVTITSTAPVTAMETLSEQIFASFASAASTTTTTTTTTTAP